MNRSDLPIIVVDIDNTVSDHVNRINKFIDPISGEIPYEEANSNEAVSKDEPINGSIEAINIISIYYRVVWLTARKKHLAETTENWLKQYKFQVDDLIFVEYFDDKIPHLVSLKPKLFIDDLKYDYFSKEPKLATKMIRQLIENSIPYFIFNNNWDDVLEILELK